MFMIIIILSHIIIRYRWIFYINPNYYGFSASANILLSGINNDCADDGDEIFECYARSGEYVLKQFNFDSVNPFMHIAVSYEIIHTLSCLIINPLIPVADIANDDSYILTTSYFKQLVTSHKLLFEFME